MISETVKKTINSHNYEVSYLPAFYNTKLFMKFSSVVSASLPDIFKMANDKSDWANVGEAINKIITSIYVNDPTCELILEIMSQTKRNGICINKTNFDEMYTGNISEMTKALLFSCEVHFKPFLPLENLVGLLKEKEPMKTQTLAT